MSLDVSREEYESKVKSLEEKSVFKLPIKNTLGLDNLKSKAELKSYALAHPVEYTQMRTEAYTSVVENAVEGVYESLWKLLKEGKVGDRNVFDNSNDAKMKTWSPQLQDAEVARLATGFAESIMNLYDEIFEKICPSDYKQLADDKITHLAKMEIAK